MSGDVIDLRDARFVREVEALHTLGPDRSPISSSRSAEPG
jgi:hypothetical protein